MSESVRNPNSEEDIERISMAEQGSETSDYHPVSLQRLSSPTTTMSDTDDQQSVSPQILSRPTIPNSTTSDVDDQASETDRPEEPISFPQSDPTCPPWLNCSVIITIPQKGRTINDGAIFLGIRGSQTSNGNGKISALFRLEPELPTFQDSYARVVFTTRAAAGAFIHNTKFVLKTRSEPEVRGISPLFIDGNMLRVVWDCVKYPPASRQEHENYSRAIRLCGHESAFDLAAIEASVRGIPGVGFYEINEEHDEDLNRKIVDMSFSSIAQGRAAFKNLKEYLLENGLDHAIDLTYGLDPCDCVQVHDTSTHSRFWLGQ